jgi:cytochrome c-type biogenesis protein
MTPLENLSVMVALGAGLLSFLSPCVLPLVLSYLSFITGISFDDLKAPRLSRHLWRKAFSNSLFFVLGFSMVFIALGASVSFLGRFLIGRQEMIQRIAGLIIIFFGLYIAGVFKIPILMRSRELLSLRSRPAGYAGSGLIGISFGLTWTPCVGPILGAILTLAGGEGEVNQGVILLSAYSMGLAVPFLLTAAASGPFFHLFQRFGKFLRVVHIAGGILLIFVGVLVFTGYFTFLNSLFVQLMPSWIRKRI